MIDDGASCIVCGNTDWMALPVSAASHSVRSDGAILNHPLKKAQCSKCGMIRSCEVPEDDTLRELYTNDYDIYNKRPDSEQFVAGRYRALAQAIVSSVRPFVPERVLEVGCGNGAALREVSALWPGATSVGMEPVTSAVQAAQAANINVHQGMVGGVVPDAVGAHQYDVIYSIHVIEHTQDPVKFLEGLKAMLSPRGRLIITCPNARQPNLEIMRADHHYSMLPHHLNILARKAGLLPIKSALCPGGGEDLDYEHNQLLVCCLPDASDNVADFPELPDELSDAGRMQLFGARSKYFHDFGKLDSALLERLNGAKKIFCFGTGGWTCMLAGYAPGVWERVQACVIDGGSNHIFYGKKVLPYEHLAKQNPDGVIIGINPATQPIIARRMETDGIPSVRWDDLISM